MRRASRPCASGSVMAEAAVRSVLAVLVGLALCVLGLASCAARNVYLTQRDLNEMTEMVRASLAPADSVTLTYTAPTYGSLGCEPDTTKPLHDWLRVAVMRLRGQAPSWYPGAERDSAAWRRVVAECQPDTIAWRWVLPGWRDSVRVGSGQYIAVPFNSAGPARCHWRIVTVGP